MLAETTQQQNLQFLQIQKFITEKGELVENQELSWQVFGQPLGSAPVVLVIHALTGNSAVAGEAGWWNYLIGDGMTIDTRHYSILAFDIPGNGFSGRKTAILPRHDLYTARDIARLFGLGLRQLGIKKLHAIIGGSLGGGIAWELAALQPDLSKHLVPIAADWKATDWIIAHNRVQEEILQHSRRPLEIARMMAMLFYRSGTSFTEKFGRKKQDLQNSFQVESWLLHHGIKLKNRFSIQSYKTMNHLLSSIDISRGRESVQAVLSSIKSKVHQIAVNSDIFFEAGENKRSHHLLRKAGVEAHYSEIDSIHGHDAFLIEFDQLNQMLQQTFPVPRVNGSARSDSDESQNQKAVTWNLALFGPGAVGSTLLKQIRESREKILLKKGIDLKVIAVANSSSLILSDENLAEGWHPKAIQQGISYQLDDLLDYVRDKNFENLIAIDATSGDRLSSRYNDLLAAGFHLVSANKTANTFPFEAYAELRNNLQKYQRTFRYETNVGAGLPLISTIRELHESGEQIRKIRGVFSGSLSYLFNRFGRRELSFSEILEEARQFGLTEPDPREDLDGMDVARKLLILARELQLESNLEDVQVESLIPKALLHTRELNSFLSQREILDEHFEKRKAGLPANHVLRYVGEVDILKGKLSVQLQDVPVESSLGQVRGADSIFEIYSESYRQPMVIQGAGAGLDVTARGLLSDILKVTESPNPGFSKKAKSRTFAANDLQTR
ncbi:MAG: alpha/beta fold hydrolase [Bacteroidetes bacterium]|nr:alpha/beta fold hydrolase [Bacteroidota bacterium]